MPIIFHTGSLELGLSVRSGARIFGAIMDVRLEDGAFGDFALFSAVVVIPLYLCKL